MATKKIQVIQSVVTTDTSLTKSGFAADAKAVGEAITAQSNADKAEIKSYIDEVFLGGEW